MILLEEEVLPTADFLQFMAQCLDVVMKDSSLIGVSAWNDNGKYSIVNIIPNCRIQSLRLTWLHMI